MPAGARTLLVELLLDGVWTDVTTYVRQGGSTLLTIVRGRGNEQAKPTPSTCTLTFHDLDGRFRPRNPTGPYWGLIGRNTQARVSIDGVRRFTGEVTSWTQDRDVAGAAPTVQLTLSGILRRLGQGSSPIRSAPRRYIPTSDPGLIAYWPLEDGPLATAGEPVIGARAMELSATAPASRHFGQGRLGPWLNTGVAMLGASTLTGVLGVHLGFNGDWCVDHVRAGDVSTNTKLIVQTVDFTWSLEFIPSTNSITVTYPGGSTNYAIATDLWDGNAHHVRFVADQNGADTSFFVDLDDRPEISGVLSGVTNTAPRRLVLEDLNAHTEPLAVGHVVVYQNTRPLAEFADPALGYPGEPAGRRLERLCDEEGIPFTSSGDLDATTPMGPQRPARLVELLEECAAADQGTLYEPRTALGLAYRTRADLYDQSAAAVLDFAGRQVAPPLIPVDDDQQTRNEVTAKRTLGGEYTAELDTGPLSVADPPDGVGRYDAQVTLNVEREAQLRGLAEWLVHLGTVDESRWPRVSVDLSAPDVDAGLVADVLALDVDELLELTDVAAALKVSDPISLLAHGYTETLVDAYWHKLTFNCGPSLPYALGEVGTGKAGTSNSELASGVTSSATSWSVWPTVVGSWVALWTTAAGQMPIYVECGGEVVQVTAIAGASAPQTMTVVRAVNGISKAHSAGAAVRLARQSRAVVAL